MRWRPQVEHVGTMGHEIEIDEVYQPLHGGQGRLGGPQVYLLGHWDKIETPSWACRDYRT